MSNIYQEIIWCHDGSLGIPVHPVWQAKMSMQRYKDTRLRQQTAKSEADEEAYWGGRCTVGRFTSRSQWVGEHQS